MKQVHMGGYSIVIPENYVHRVKVSRVKGSQDVRLGLAETEARFQVAPEVTLLDNKGLKPAELKLAESLVEENKEMIVARWKEYFNK